MSKFPSFLEYLNDKGNVVERPNVEAIPDYHGPDEKTPEGSKVPYKTPVQNKAPAKGESGLAELGDEKLKYEPNTKLNYETKPDALKKVVKEYVDEKGKTLEKGREDIKGDYQGKTPNAPEGGGYPYVAKDEKVKVGEKGLAELGEKELEYNPDTKNAKKVTKTEGFLNKTKGMSLSEFTKYMLEECGCGQVNDETLPFITAYTTGKFQPHPPEVIKYVSVLADKNQGILENLVSQMISMGYLNKLLKTIFEHPQAYEELTSLFSDEGEGPNRCKSFAGAMNNSYAKFLSDQDGLYESVSSPIGFEKEDEDIEGDEDEDMDMEGDEDEDMGSEDTEGDEDEDMGMESDEDEDMEGDMGPPERKLKKKFAHDNLLGAMKNHEYMMKAMRGI